MKHCKKNHLFALFIEFTGGYPLTNFFDVVEVRYPITRL